MGGIDFVVAVSANQHQVLHIRPGQQILEQIERCRIEPLQVVEEQRERMFRPREYADKSPEHQLEAALRVLWRQLGNRWLLADDVLQFRDEIDNEPPFGPSASSSASRHCCSSASLLPRSGRIRL